MIRSVLLGESASSILFGTTKFAASKLANALCIAAIALLASSRFFTNSSEAKIIRENVPWNYLIRLFPRWFTVL